MENLEKTTIASYDQTVEKYIQNVDPLYPAQEGEKFMKLLHKGSTILDLGCGPGRDTKIFTEKGFKVTGIDLSEKMIEAARKRVPNADFRVMNLKKLLFTEAQFDGIWASAAYLHIPRQNIPQALGEARRVIKNHGVFFVSVKKGEGEILKTDDRYDGVKKFWSFFQKSEIEDVLTKAGFTIIESYIKNYDVAYMTHPWIYIFCRS